jgi:hypothetical protein
MNNFKTLIIWEKWVDPFGQDGDETKWTDYDNENDNIDNEDYDDTLETESPQHLINRSIKVIQSPMGLIPYNEYTAPSKLFNFWIGHTNFDITPTIIQILEKCHGVEILDIFSRYRFRIAIGKCFNDADIMTDINDQLYTFLDTQYGQS